MATNWQFDDEPENWSQDHDDENLYGDESSEDESLTVECRMCGCEVYEDAEQCPICGEWMTRRTSVWTGRSPLFVMLGMAGIVAVIASMLFLI